MTVKTASGQDAGNASEARFIHAYITAALWSSNDESDDAGGNPLDDNYTADDLDPDTRAEMEKDCAAFIDLFWSDLFRPGIYQGRSGAHAVELAGHDFWLTRNGHGCGFWDGDWQEPFASQMDAYCKRVGEYSLIVGDDGRIHGMGG
jgi:hypothetical protein